MQKYTVWSKCRLVLTALALWFALITCETMAVDLSQENKLPDHGSSPAVEHPEHVKPAPAATVDLPMNMVPTADFSILGSSIPPGTAQQLRWIASHNYAGMGLAAPVFVANGSQPGKVLCLTAAVHGDEINGVEIVRRMLHGVAVEQLRGTLVGVPIVNTHGFERSSRYLEDRRDLNRSFPGRPDGSSAARIAHSFFSQIVAHCDVLVDIHTGTLGRTYLPQIRADLGSTKVAALVRGFGALPVVVAKPSPGSLRGAAVYAGITAVTLEVGESGRLQAAHIEDGIKALTSLLLFLDMTPASAEWRVAHTAQVLYRESFKVRAPRSGIFMTQVEVGDNVESGEILATIVDPVGEVTSVIRSPDRGRVLGMALNQMVVPGFTIFRVGIDEPEFNASADSEVTIDRVSADTLALVPQVTQSGAVSR